MVVVSVKVGADGNVAGLPQNDNRVFLPRQIYPSKQYNHGRTESGEEVRRTVYRS